jgi:hypothetical protein
MREVSREASTVCPARVEGGAGRLLLERRALEVFDMLVCDGLGDGGVHCSSLSIESWFSTAIRMS